MENLLSSEHEWLAGDIKVQRIANVKHVGYLRLIDLDPTRYIATASAIIIIISIENQNGLLILSIFTWLLGLRVRLS